jgi:hypothetical protein
MIDATLAGFLQEGLGIHIGTRNERLQPNGARAIAVQVDPDGAHISVYLAEVAAARVLPDLHSNGQAAITFGRPTDDRACQIKGTFVSTRAATDDERAVMLAQRERFLDSLEIIGVARAGAAAWVTWPAVVVRIKAAQVFDQTPGANAGAPLT